MAYEDLTYPLSTDFFQEVADGSGPSNIIYARYLNKVQRALAAVEGHSQYTPATAGATGAIVYTTQRYVKLTQDQPEPGLRFPIDVTVDAAIASQHFGGSPFNRAYPVFASAIGYRIVGGVRQYFTVRSAVHVGQENSNLTCTINTIKDTRWRQNDIVEVTLMIVNRGIVQCPASPGSFEMLLRYRFTSGAFLDNTGTKAGFTLSQGDICDS
jgi:hypothetical protein